MMENDWRESLLENIIKFHLNKFQFEIFWTLDENLNRVTELPAGLSDELWVSI